VVLLAVALAYFMFDKFVLAKARETTSVEAARQRGAETEPLLGAVVVAALIHRSFRAGRLAVEDQ